MFAQTFVIIKKEWKDLTSTLFSYHNLLAGVWPIILFCIAFGVYEPLRLGSGWLQSSIMVLSLSMLIPFTVIGFISPYSFVGERTRGTLEPLLATPVTDQAIIFGKIGISFLCGWGVTIITLLLGLGIITLFFTKGLPLLYPPGVAIMTGLLSLFFSLLVAILGTNSSLYAKTILEAQRNLVMTLFIPMLLPAFFVGPFMPVEWKGVVVQIIADFGVTNLLLILVGLLLIIDSIIIIITLSRFHRKELMLEQY